MVGMMMEVNIYAMNVKTFMPQNLLLVNIVTRMILHTDYVMGAQRY